MNIEQARQHMISQQVRSWDVTDPRTLDCLAHVQREHYVPDEFTALAFFDTAISLGHGQHMLKPVVEGRMLQSLNPEPDNRVLVIGTGSGFITACVAHLSDHVTSVEIIPELHQRAGERLTDAKVHNVDTQLLDFNELQPTRGFDRILVTGSMPTLDPRLADWLNPNGVCIAIIGDAPAMSVERIQRIDEQYTRERLFETVVTPLKNVTSDDTFEF
jgi:protein-L-isoaspartate(D-aspartate) O-methyltransferase